MTIAEIDARRPEFAGGTEIILADGAAWSFPAVSLDHFRPRRDPDGSIQWSGVSSRGPDYDELIDRYIEAEDGIDQVNALTEMAILLLGVNYSLTFDEIAGLLIRYPAGHPKRPDGDEMWDAIRRVAFGEAPKPTPVGSVAPSSPTGSNPGA